MDALSNLICRLERWFDRPLAETRWLLELSRLLIDPVFAGHGIPHGDGRPSS